MKEIIYIHIINLRQSYPRSWTLYPPMTPVLKIYTQYSIQHHASYILVPSFTVQSKSEAELDFTDRWIICGWICCTKQNRNPKTQVAPHRNTGEPLDLTHDGPVTEWFGVSFGSDLNKQLLWFETLILRQCYDQLLNNLVLFSVLLRNLKQAFPTFTCFRWLRRFPW